jgi:UDP-N-acetylglucosamine pyrophosphorylase
MAAGKGTRMNDTSRAKVMYEIEGKPLVQYVVELAIQLEAKRIVAIVGYQRETVMHFLKKTFPSIEFAIQDPQMGTGHAVIQTEPMLRNFSGEVLVLSGDVPLLTEQTMNELAIHHHRTGAIATILSADFDDPTGYGRIIKNADGSVNRIIEHRDATEQERQVKEINSGIYLFDAGKLYEGLLHITPHNAQNEYYLTDVFAYFWKHHLPVQAYKTSKIDEIHGINTIAQLERATRLMPVLKP